jgi:hypothetical protein
MATMVDPNYSVDMPPGMLSIYPGNGILRNWAIKFAMEMDFKVRRGGNGVRDFTLLSKFAQRRFYTAAVGEMPPEHLTYELGTKRRIVYTAVLSSLMLAMITH